MKERVCKEHGHAYDASLTQCPQCGSLAWYPGEGMSWGTVQTLTQRADATDDVEAVW